MGVIELGTSGLRFGDKNMLRSMTLISPDEQKTDTADCGLWTVDCGL